MTQFHTEDRKMEVEKQGEMLAGSGTFSLETVFRPFLLSQKRRNEWKSVPKFQKVRLHPDSGRVIW
jgi:hypothetical protein